MNAKENIDYQVSRGKCQWTESGATCSRRAKKIATVTDGAGGEPEQFVVCDTHLPEVKRTPYMVLESVSDV